jgi:DnaJ domain
MSYTDAQLKAVMEMLDITAPELRQACRNGHQLEALKRRVKRAYRHAAFELHPDRNGGDPVRTDLFRLLSETVEAIQALEPTPPKKWALRLSFDLRG